MLQKGFIYKSLHTEEDPHYIICMQDSEPNKETYNACIITHDGTSTDAPRFLMKPSHFKNKLFCKVTFDRKRGTYLVKVGFEKKEVRISPTAVGELTQEGIQFVEDHMRDCDYAYFPYPMSRYEKGYKLKSK